jgi:hypothetical protein
MGFTTTLVGRGGYIFFEGKNTLYCLYKKFYEIPPSPHKYLTKIPYNST